MRLFVQHHGRNALVTGLVVSMLMLAGTGCSASGANIPAATGTPTSTSITHRQTKDLLTYHGHSDRATAVAWSPDGKYVVSGSLDKTVQVWSVSTGKTRLIYRGHTDGILAVAWSPGSRSIVSGSLDHTVQVWQATTGKPILTYRGHSAPVNTVMWSPDGKHIASGSVDTTVQVWDARTGKVRYIYHGYNVAVAHVDNSKGVLPDLIFFVGWSHNGKRIVAVTQEYCGDTCAVVMTWDAQTGKHLVFYPDVVVYAIAWSPDDTRFASAIESTDVQIALVP